MQLKQEHTRIRPEATYQDAQCILVLVFVILLNVPKFCSPRPALLEGECQFVPFTTALVSGSRQAFLNAMLLPGTGFPRGFTAHIKLNPQTQSPELASRIVGTAFDPRPCDDLHVISQGPKDRTFRGGKKAEAGAAIAAQQTHYHVLIAWVMWCIKYLVRGSGYRD